MLFVCSALQQERLLLWDRTVQSLPLAMRGSVISMNAEQRTIFLCGGLNSPYVAEWQNSYEAIARFLSELYIHRMAAAEALHT
jgi:hypothetical protein